MLIQIATLMPTWTLPPSTRCSNTDLYSPGLYWLPRWYKLPRRSGTKMQQLPRHYWLPRRYRDRNRLEDVQVTKMVLPSLLFTTPSNSRIVAYASRVDAPDRCNHAAKAYAAMEHGQCIRANAAHAARTVGASPPQSAIVDHPLQSGNVSMRSLQSQYLFHLQTGYILSGRTPALQSGKHTYIVYILFYFIRILKMDSLRATKAPTPNPRRRHPLHSQILPHLEHCQKASEIQWITTPD